jgi:origin recognition complex subunit 3
MSHFYGNALSVLCDNSEPADITRVLEDRHYEAIRTLPSFKKHIDRLVRSHESSRIRALLQDDKVLSEEVKQALRSRQKATLQLLRTIHVFQSASNEVIDAVNLYMTVFEGNLQHSDFVKVLLASLKRMAPAQILTLLSKITIAIREGNPGMSLDGWTLEDEDFLVDIQDIERKIIALSNAADDAEIPVRSSETIHNKGLRTTVVAQRVQLSYAESTLTVHEKEFLEQNEILSDLLEKYFTTDDPRQLFLSEIWLCNATAVLLEAFAPRPRAAVEYALSAPDQFLGWEGTSDSHPQTKNLQATAVLYQRYLEAGSLINMADLWSSFLEIVAGDEEEPDEREVLMQFYRALADLKSMGMVKQSKKKADHLAKVSWKGL